MNLCHYNPTASNILRNFLIEMMDKRSQKHMYQFYRHKIKQEGHLTTGEEFMAVG